MKDTEKLLALVAVIAVVAVVAIYMMQPVAPVTPAAITPTEIGTADAVTIKSTNPIDTISKVSVSGVTFGVQLPNGQVYNTTTPGDLTSQVGATDYFIGDDTTYYKEDISWKTISPGSGRTDVTFGGTIPEVAMVGTMSATSDPSTFNTTASGYQQTVNVTASTSVVGTILKDYLITINDPSGIVTSAYASQRAGGECSVAIPPSNWRDEGLALGDIYYNAPCDLKLTFNYNSALSADTYTFTVYKYDLNGKNYVEDANLRSILGTGATDDSFAVAVLFE